MENNVRGFHIIKHSSIFYRLSQAYFNETLKNTGIGAGQQFFLDRIERNPGIGVVQLAQMGQFDNGTVTRAVKKLIDEGYVEMAPDALDARCKKLYATEKARPVVALIRDMKDNWRSSVMRGFTLEEKKLAGELLGRLSENALAALKSLEGNAGE